MNRPLPPYTVARFDDKVLTEILVGVTYDQAMDWCKMHPQPAGSARSIHPSDFYKKPKPGKA